MKSNRLGMLLAASMAVAMLSALAATAAQASIPPGPLWLVGCHKVLVPKTGEFKNSTCTEAEAKGEFTEKLLTNETRNVRSTSRAGVFTLSGAISVECKNVTDKGVLLGGNPGTDHEEITFSECFLEKFPNCVATGLKPLKAPNKGEVLVDVYTVLGNADPETKSAQDAFAAVGEAEHPNLFVEFELTGAECPSTIKSSPKVRVEGTGTELEVHGVKRKCGQLGEVGEISSSEAFRLALSGEKAEKGALRFSKKSAKEKEVEIYNRTTGNFELSKCTLEADHAPAEELGLSEINTEPAERFGWTI